VSGGGYIGEFLAYFNFLRQCKKGYWSLDFIGFYTPVNAIDQLIAKLAQARKDIEARIGHENQFWSLAERDAILEREQLFANMEERIRQLLHAGPKSKQELKEGSRWEGEKPELDSYEGFYARAIDNLKKSKKIQWNKESKKWELMEEVVDRKQGGTNE
jgi:hypothetical protein